MPKEYSRRSFLRGMPALAALAPLVTESGSAQQQHFHATPENSASTTMAPMGAAEDDPILAAACRQRVTALQGLSPMQFLTHFDYGVVTDEKGRKVREFQLNAMEKIIEVAPGIMMDAWTYNGTVPGPTLRCMEGDLVRVRFTNKGKTEHTVHFHGIHDANMDGVDELVQPGESTTYEFMAEPAALQLYHCHSAPVSLHMNRGLFGAFIIDPRIPRPPAREMVVVLHGWDTNYDRKNELYAMNGAANFYRDNPIPLRVGEAARIYLINAMEYEPVSSFHIHANFFKLLRTGAAGQPAESTDLVTLTQAERCILEFSYRSPGLYMFHPHQNAVAERGCTGHFIVS